MLWTCPYWLTEAILNLVRWHHFRLDYANQTADGRSDVPLQQVTTWTKTFLAVSLLIVDVFSSWQVKSRYVTHITIGSHNFRSQPGSTRIIIKNTRLATYGKPLDLLPEWHVTIS